MIRPVVIQRPTDRFQDCPLDIRGRERFFMTPSNRAFQITDESVIVYDGSPFNAQEMNFGTRANIRIQKDGTVAECEIVFLARKATIQQQFNETVIAFSLKKFSPQLLNHVWDDNPQTKPAIRFIGEKFMAIRRIAGEGMRAFFTAVGIAYLEHLMLPKVPNSQFEQFYWELGQNEDSGLQRYLDQLWNAKQQGSGNEALDQFNSDSEFSAVLQKAIIFLLLAFVKTNPQNEKAAMCLAICDGVDEFRTNLEYSNELDQTVMALAAFVLPIRLKVYSGSLNEALESPFDCDPAKPALAYVSLLLKTNTFCVLYTRAQCCAEGFVNTLERREPHQLSEMMFRALYYTPKRREEMKGVAVEEEAEKQSTEVALHLELQESLQKLVGSLFTALENKEIRNGYPFFSDELIVATYESKAQYRKNLSKLRLSLPDYQWESKLDVLEQTPSFASASLMKQCKKCDQHPGVIFLPVCRDYICDFCMRKYLEEFLVRHKRILEPNGEPVRDLICPIRTCVSPETIPASIIRTYLGVQFDAYVEQAERVVMTKKCIKCGVVHEHRLFHLINACGCKICAYCLIELVGSNQGYCLCGQYIPQDVIMYASQQPMRCPVCSQDKSLLQDFTPVKCSDHILCKLCLEAAIERPDKRCPLDYRVFGDYEIEQAKVYFKRSCMLYCNQTYESSRDLVPLQCRCVYCWECLKCAAKYTRQIQVCYVCTAYMPREVVAKLEEYKNIEAFMVTIKADVHKAKGCDMCLAPIGRVQKFVLPSCAHDFHKQCLKDYASDYTGTDFKAPIKCPKQGCAMEIDGNSLQHELLTTKEFTKYSDKLININFNIMQCPACGLKFEFVKNEQIEIEAVRCSCGFAFCRECKKEFTANHDARLCRHNAILETIAEMEAISTEKVAQCPGCQTPYQKDDHCDHVKCIKPGCVDWCFKCSCLRAPTLEHHNMWHRPQCPHYTAVPNDNEPQRPKCPECIRLKRRCDQPKDLKVVGRFDLDEY